MKPGKDNLHASGSLQGCERIADGATALTIIFCLLLVTGILPEFFQKREFILPFLAVTALPSVVCYLTVFISDLVCLFRNNILKENNI